MLALVSRLLLPFVVLVAFFLLLRGHNEPGGGFIAGLVLAIGLILQYIANGQRWTDGAAAARILAVGGWRAADRGTHRSCERLRWAARF